MEKLIKDGFEVIIESGAGEGSSFSDDAFEKAGARIVDHATVWKEPRVIAKVRAPEELSDGSHEAELLNKGQLLISFYFPAQNEDLSKRIAKTGASLLAVDSIPRISRAQKVDALSSMANIAGYRAVVEAANRFGSFFTGQFTAAGKIPPAKILVIGAGVAGLAAIAAAKGLGAIVRAFDTRLAVKDQIQSLGAEFLEMEFEESGDGGGGYAKTMSKEFIDAEMALFREQAKDVNIVITTALIPGKKAPILWTEDMVKAMRPGGVVVDLAAEQGGNCELTEPGKAIVKHDITIVGYADLPSRMGNVASDLYGTNIWHLVNEMGGSNDFKIDMENEIVLGSMVVHEGKVTWPPPAPKKPAIVEEDKTKQLKKETEKPATETKPIAKKKTGTSWFMPFISVIFAAGWVYLRWFSADTAMDPEMIKFVEQLTVFVLSCFIGWQVIWNVAPALHTPLMSVTNAISGIIIIGGLFSAGIPHMDTSAIIGAVAAFFATINIAGGFLVTKRMLQMFRKD